MQQTAIETLNDLILINNDRLKGYERTLKDSKGKHADLEIVFREMIAQTRRFNETLITLVQQNGSRAETESSISGKLHRTWMDFKTTFTGSSRKSLLIECERGEDASKEAYNEALHEDNGLPDEQRDIIAAQAAEQSQSHDRIKALRDEVLKGK